MSWFRKAVVPKLVYKPTESEKLETEGEVKDDRDPTRTSILDKLIRDTGSIRTDAGKQRPKSARPAPPPPIPRPRRYMI